MSILQILIKYLLHCQLFNIIRHQHLFDKSTTFDKFTTKVKTSQSCNNSGRCILIIIFEKPFAIKKPVAVMTTSTHWALVFKILAKQKKINVKMFPSKEVVKSKTVP